MTWALAWSTTACCLALFGLGLREHGLGAVQGDLVLQRVDAREHLPGLHVAVFVDEHLRHRPRDARRDLVDVPVDVGVVRFLERQRMMHETRRPPQRARAEHEHHEPEHRPALLLDGRRHEPVSGRHPADGPFAAPLRHRRVSILVCHKNFLSASSNLHPFLQCAAAAASSAFLPALPPSRNNNGSDTTNIATT